MEAVMGSMGGLGGVGGGSLPLGTNDLAPSAPQAGTPQSLPIPNSPF